MQLTHLLIFSCLLCVSACTDRDTINKIEEFKKYFSNYANQTSEKTLFPILRNHGNVCPCANGFLKKLQESFGKQNTTEVLMMKDILKSLMGQVQKTSRLCPHKNVAASETNNFETFFQRFLSQNCIRQSKPKID